MTNQSNLFITFSGKTERDQIVDSYDLIRRITVKLVGQNKITFHIDNTLPLIKGDPETLEGLFSEFIQTAINHFSGMDGRLNIVHIKDPKSWIFAFFVEGEDENKNWDDVTNLVETVTQFTLAISKKTFKNTEEVDYKVSSN
ncbi:hypothetical protein JYB64_08625 [Algoriphagus aestuarii]|nr:hypothetical protein [Algoriphagus aestuarii]